MKSIRVFLLIAVAASALSHQSDGQQARPLGEQLKLAGVMPRGALVYLQVRDLNTLSKTWVASPTHEAFYNSASFKNFEKSNIYLKFQDRRKDFERLASAWTKRFVDGAARLCVALYDIGKSSWAGTDVGAKSSSPAHSSKHTVSGRSLNKPSPPPITSR